MRQEVHDERVNEGSLKAELTGLKDSIDTLTTSIDTLTESVDTLVKGVSGLKAVVNDHSGSPLCGIFRISA